MKNGTPEYGMRTAVNANSATKISRHVTATERFHILVLTHDGFVLKIYKSSSAEPIEQVSIWKCVAFTCSKSISIFPKFLAPTLTRHA